MGTSVREQILEDLRAKRMVVLKALEDLKLDLSDIDATIGMLSQPRAGVTVEDVRTPRGVGRVMLPGPTIRVLRAIDGGPGITQEQLAKRFPEISPHVLKSILGQQSSEAYNKIRIDERGGYFTVKDDEDANPLSNGG